MRASTSTITFRPAYADDNAAVQRLVELDSAVETPPAPLLLAEIDGQVRVALSLDSGEAIADPFYATTDTLRLMRAHARTRTPHDRRATAGRSRQRRLHLAFR